MCLLQQFTGKDLRPQTSKASYTHMFQAAASFTASDRFLVGSIYMSYQIDAWLPRFAVSGCIPVAAEPSCPPATLERNTCMTSTQTLGKL